MICDINEGRGKIDFEKFSKGMEFVIIRSSVGTRHDARYREYVEGCKKYDIPYHAFHYVKATTEAAARTEAKVFAEATEGTKPISYAIDAEYSEIKPSKARSIIDAFEDGLRHYISKDICVGIYIGHHLYKSWNLDYDHYDYVWIPRYGSKKPDFPCDIWQYSETGRISGVNANVDLDVLTGTKPLEFFTKRGGESMATKRMPINEFVKELEAAYKRKDGYIMGSYGQNPRTGYLDLSIPESKCKSSWKESGYYYKQYSGTQLKKALEWRKNCTRVWDCNGMAEGIYELYTGTCINSKARYNYANWCSVKGSGLIPVKYRVPGAAVFWSNSKASSIHHVAYLYKPVASGKPEGDWYLIEAQGVAKGVVKTKLNSRKPNYWGIMDKYYEYENISETIAEEETIEVKNLLGSRVLKNGSEGDDVKEMQSGLIRLGYDLGKWGADGDFGDCTEEAVMSFQSAHKLEMTGKFDEATFKAFEEAIANLDKVVESPKYVIIEGGKCNIRKTPGTDGERLNVAHEGEKYEYGGVTDEATGWYSIKYKKGIAWVSYKYGRLTK